MNKPTFPRSIKPGYIDDGNIKSISECDRCGIKAVDYWTGADDWDELIP